MSKLDIVVVPLTQKNRATIKQLGVRRGRYLEEIWQEEDPSTMSGQKLIHQNEPNKRPIYVKTNRSKCRKPHL